MSVRRWCLQHAFALVVSYYLLAVGAIVAVTYWG